MTLRICVFGAGAVGGYLAARLAKAGREVAVVARGAHLAAIRERGLTLETPLERFTVQLPATADPAELGPQDLVIVTAKTPALPAIAAALDPLLQARTAVAFAVNGVFWFYGAGFAPGGRQLDTRRLDPQGELAREIEPQRAIGMVIYSPNEVVAPGEVRNGRRHDNRFVIGEALPAATTSPRLLAIAEALDGCGFIVEPVADLRRAMWIKLVHNVAGTPLCALAGADLPTTFAEPAMRHQGSLLLGEALAVAAAHGFADLGIDAAREFAGRPRLQHRPSMLQDLERGRPLEIDSMLGIVADFARAAGIATPTLDLVLALLETRVRAAQASSSTSQ